LPRQGYFFCLETKEAKIQDSRKASLRSWPYPAKPAEPGLESFYPFASPLFACASVKISYALQPHRPPLFCRFSAEAFLLSGGGGAQIVLSSRAERGSSRLT